MKQYLPFLPTVLIGFLLCFCTAGSAQPWLKPPYYNNPHPDSTNPVLLKDIQEAFEQWTEAHPVAEPEDENPPKSDEEEEQRPGWLQFKRWENHMKPRVYPSGDVSLPSKNYQIYQDFISSQRRVNGPVLVTGSWVAKGPSSVPSGGGAGRINFIRFNPLNSNTIWIGAPAGGLWKSTNGGTSWSTNTDALGVIGSSDVVINPLDTNTMYLATGDGDAYDNNSIGVLKSTDGGNSWNTTGLTWNVSSYYIIRKMVMNPSDTTMLILASNNGIYRSTNSGTSWTLIQSGDFYDVAFKPGTPATVYAVSTSFYLSTNTGASFTPVATGLPNNNVERMEIGVSAANSSYVYVLASNNSYSAFLGLYLSTNSGTSFTTKSTSPNLLGYNTDGSDTTSGQGWYTLSIAVNPTNASDVYIGGVNHWRSTNAGSTWTCLTQWYGCCGFPYTHADVHNIAFLPGSSTTLFSGNDGGIFKSTNNGTAWTDISNNLEIAEMYRLGTCAVDSNLTITGHQDNGTNLMNANTWSYVIGGDGMEAAIGHTHSNLMFGEIYYGEIYKSTNTGGAFNQITNSTGTGVNAQGDWVTPYVMHPTNDSTLLVGKYQVFRTINAGNTWAQAGTLPIDSPDEVVALAYAPSNANYIYAASPTRMFVTTNGGTTWTEITGTLPVGSANITYIAVSGSNPSKVWVTFSGYSSGNKVYASANTGSTWTNYSTGLPNLPVNCIAYQNHTNDGLYVGTDVGVYFISTTLGAWQAFNTGLPNVEVDELEIQYQMNKMRAATFGRGLWQTGLAIPVAAFSASQTNTCTGTTVNFTDQSIGTPTGWSWTLTGASPASSTSPTPSVTYAAAGTFPVTLTVSNSEGSDTTTISGYITVVAASVGGTATALSSTLCAGSTTSLSLTGNTGSIQWQSSADNVTFANITGATSSGYTTATLTSTTYYRAVVTSGSCPSANSTKDTVVVSPHSVGGTATATNASLCLGSATSVSLTGNTGTIQWQSSADNIIFTNIGGATSATYNTPALSVTTYYRAVVTSGVCASANSSTAIIVISPVSIGGTAPATMRTLCSGSTTSLTLSGNTGSIQWQSSIDNLTFANISGATSATYATPALTTTTYYRVVVTSGVCASVNSVVDTVAISPHSVGGTATVLADTLCSGNSTSVTLSGNTGTLQWQSSADNITFTNIGGATTATYTTPALTATTYYRALVTSGVCAAANSAADTVVVNPHSVAGVVTAVSNTLCSGSSTSITLSGNTGGIQWQSSTDNLTFSNITGATSAGYNTPPLTATTYYRVVVTSGVCASVNTLSDTVTVNPVSVSGTATAVADTLCAGNATSVVLTGYTGALQWQSSTDNITFTNISSATSAAYPTPTLSASTYYRAIVTSGVCPSVNSTAVAVVVNPHSAGGTATAVNATICSGSSTSLILTGNTGTVQWQSSADNITYANIAGGTSGTYITPALNATTYYRALVTSGVCASANSTTDTVTVNQLSAGGTTTANADTLCFGASTLLTLSGYTGTIQWQTSADDISFSNITGAISLGYTTPSLNASAYYRAVVTNGVCPASNSTTNAITVNPLSAGGTATGTLSTLCTGNSTTITLTGYTGAIQWQSSADDVTFVNVVGATSANYNTPVLNTTTYFKAVITSGVCASATSAAATINVNPLSVGGISTAADDTLCSGSATSISLSGNTGALQWQSSTDNITFTNIAGATNTSYSTPGLTVTSYYRAVVTSGVCASVNSSPSAVTILPLTTITLQPVSQSTCIGGNVTLNSAAVGANVQYQWFKGSASINAATQSSYIIPVAALADSGAYWVSVSGTCGNVVSDTVQFTITPSLTVSLQPVSESTCLGSPVIFLVLANGINVHYQWMKDLTNLSGATSASYTLNAIAATDSGAYACSISSGCGDTISASANLTVLQPSFYNYNYLLCNGSNYTFNGRNLNNAGTYKDTLQAANTCDSIITLNLQLLPVYSNSVNAAICAGSTYPFYGRNLSIAGAYADTLSSTSGCDSIINLNLTQNVATYSAVRDSFCQGSSYTFNNRIFTQAGVYKDTLANANSCDSIVTLTLATKVQPVVTLNLLPDTVCKNGATVTLSGGSPAGGTYSGTNITGNTFNPAQAVTGTHVITYTFADANGCSSSDSSYLTVEVCIGINETSIDDLVSVYPNPADNLLIAECDLFGNSKPVVLVYDVMGQILNPNIEYEGNKIILHIDYLASGTYWLSVKTGDKTATKLFEKIK